jgi:hypothetical protein
MSSSYLSQPGPHPVDDFGEFADGAQNHIESDERLQLHETASALFDFGPRTTLCWPHAPTLQHLAGCLLV